MELRGKDSVNRIFADQLTLAVREGVPNGVRLSDRSFETLGEDNLLSELVRSVFVLVSLEPCESKKFEEPGDNFPRPVLAVIHLPATTCPTGIECFLKEPPLKRYKAPAYLVLSVDGR